MLAASLSLTSCWEDDVPPVLPPVEDDGGDTPTDVTPTFTLNYGENHFDYTGYEPCKDKPVEIWSYIPVGGDVKKMPVLMVFPGESLDADMHIRLWEQLANDKKIMLFGFAFKSASNTTEYTTGGIRIGGKNIDVAESWSFNCVEQFFKELRALTDNENTTYDMWGHSAGGQFVHRFVTFMPEASIGKAVAANPGWYTMPTDDFGYDFPHSIKGINCINWAEALPKLFGRKMYVQLGLDDTDRSGLNTAEGSEKQGQNRLERGRYYFEQSKQKAKKLGCPFLWEKTEVPGVGHNAMGMQAAAAKVLY